MKRMKSNKGFTLIEVILALSLLAMVITLSASMINLSSVAHRKTVEEYNINSMIRIASEKANEIIRYSKAIFAVPIDYIADVSKMDSGWSYYAVSSDKRRVVNFVYDEASDTHVEQVLVEESPNVEYEIVFEKDTEDTLNDNLLKFKIIGYVISVDAEGNRTRTGDKVVLESEVEAQNALQIVDKGTQLSPSVALAFRNDSSAQGTGRNQVAKIAIVLDVSGSMDTALAGGTRLGHVKNALLGYTKADGTVVEGMINSFSRENNIEISIIPFSQTANYPSPNVFSNEKHPFYNAEEQKTALVNQVTNLNTYGSTNTGDGLRRGYYNLMEYVPTNYGYNANTEEYNYMIVLVDGETNESSWTGNGYYFWIFPVFNESAHYTGNQGIYPNISYDNVTRNYTYSQDNSGYITNIGGKIVNAEASGDKITSYVIGYNTGLTSEITFIGEKLGAKQTLNYDSPDFNLDEVFSNIAQDILAELWLVTGPKIND